MSTCIKNFLYLTAILLSITNVSSFIHSPILKHHQSVKLSGYFGLKAKKEPLLNDKTKNDNIQTSVILSVAKCSLLLSILATIILSSTASIAEEAKEYNGFTEYAKENQIA